MNIENGCFKIIKKFFFFSILIFVFSGIKINSFCEETKQQNQNIQQVQRKTILDFKEELQLTEKQVKDIEKLITDFQKRTDERINKIRENDKKLKELLVKEGDIKEIGKLVREIYKLRGEIEVDNLESARKIDNLLTNQQKEKWKEIRGIKKE